jgi:hypothetical protein
MRRLFQCLVAIALIAAVGGHWAFLQSVAWVSMTIEYSRDGSVLEALQKTFSGEKPCRLCKAVDAGRKSERQQAILKLEPKLEFTELQTFLPIYPRIVEASPAAASDGLVTRSQAPPTPPPRSA